MSLYTLHAPRTLCSNVLHTVLCISMAFPIPSHLPRKKDPQDVSTKILTKISEADAKSLNAALASSWSLELDETLTQTKVNYDVSALVLSPNLI